MAYRVFVDGAEGTTGLSINDRLEARGDMELIHIDSALRKDKSARAKAIRRADVAFLCLPDEAARESAALAEGSGAVIINASTAHRTAPGWAYGFSELSPEFRANIARAKRVSVPGCHATGAIAAVYPLMSSGVMSADYPLCVHSITGYSGGGKKMIAEYQSEDRSSALNSPRQYGLSQDHKHLSEMKYILGLNEPPLFNPIVCDFYAGMAVSVPIHTRLLKKRMGLDTMTELLADHYAGQQFVSVMSWPGDGFIPANQCAGSNMLVIYVCGNDERITLISVLDNLGKGSSGAAMQCMNIALGLPEHMGLL
jgi:N-acetyl-gamma-glutamyl-phosphate reductase